MSSTYSTLKFELIGTGDQAGSWGSTTNTNLGTAVEQAIAGKATCITADFTSNVATYTLADTNASQTARAYILDVTATLTGAGTINLPAISKPYIVINNSVGGFAVTVKVSGQTGVSIPNGKRAMVYNNGTDVGTALDYLPTLALGTALPASSGGTGVATLTGIVKGNGTSAMTAATGAEIVSAIGATAVTNATNATNATTATNVAGGTTGAVHYQSGVGATAFLGIGVANQVLTVNSGATAPQWVDQATLTVGSATTATSATSATTATNLAGGAANRIAYQTGANTTAFVTAPSSANTYLSWDGSNFAWGSSTIAPAGSNTQIQYNNSGSLGASSNFTYDGTTVLVGLTANAQGLKFSNSATTSSDNSAVAFYRTLTPPSSFTYSVGSHDYFGKNKAGTEHQMARAYGRFIPVSSTSTYGMYYIDTYLSGAVNTRFYQYLDQWQFVVNISGGVPDTIFAVDTNGGYSAGPGVDNQVSAGRASYRYTTVYATTGTINTSDANLKEQVQSLEDAELRVASAIKGLFKKYKWKDAVAKKGDAARIHVGVIAQEVEAVFVAEGLDPERYALFCKDVWWEKMAPADDYDGNGEPRLVLKTFQEEVEGGTRKERRGIRYDQLLAFVIAAL